MRLPTSLPRRTLLGAVLGSALLAALPAAAQGGSVNV